MRLPFDRRRDRRQPEQNGPTAPEQSPAPRRSRRGSRMHYTGGPGIDPDETVDLAAARSDFTRPRQDAPRPHNPRLGPEWLAEPLPPPPSPIQWGHEPGPSAVAPAKLYRRLGPGWRQLFCRAGESFSLSRRGELYVQIAPDNFVALPEYEEGR